MGFVFPFENQEEVSGDPRPGTKTQSKEDATVIFQKARALWNEMGLAPECRELIIPPVHAGDCLNTFQHYSWDEIRNAIRNYDWHIKGRCGLGYARPPPYGSIYGFLKAGVARYFDDDALDIQFKEKGL